MEIGADDWVRGGTPRESRIVPWGVQSIGSDDVDYWQGRLEGRIVSEAIDALVAVVRD